MYSLMEECLSVSVIQFLTSQPMLTVIQRCVHMWLTESGPGPGRHRWLMLAWWRLLEQTHPDDQPEWENYTQVNGCRERRSCWPSSEWKSLNCKEFGLLAITPCFFRLSCALSWIFCLKHEGTLPRGKFCLWKSTDCGLTAGVVKVTLCFALKKGLQQINQWETQFSRGWGWGCTFCSWEGTAIRLSPLAHVAVQLFAELNGKFQE